MKPTYKLKDQNEEVKKGAPPSELKIASKHSAGFYVGVIKNSLEEHEVVSIASLGTAHSIAANAVDILVKNGYVTVASIKTDTVEVQNERGSDQRKFRRARLLISVQRTADFFKLSKEYQALRESNSKQAESETSKPSS